MPDRRTFVVSSLQRRGKEKKGFFFVVFVLFVSFVVLLPHGRVLDS